jgi:hypothetical protein
MPKNLNEHFLPPAADFFSCVPVLRGRGAGGEGVSLRKGWPPHPPQPPSPEYGGEGSRNVSYWQRSRQQCLLQIDAHVVQGTAPSRRYFSSPFFASTTDFIFASPSSKLPPTVLSRSMKRQTALLKKFFWPDMLHVTFV